MRSIFFLLSASCAVSNASECQAEETSLLQGRSLVHHKRNTADDPLLLQTRADAAAVKDPDIKRQIHRFRVHVQDELVSLLQDSRMTEATVYQICADDDSGSDEEATDRFSTKVETCGPVTVRNEAGELVASPSMCAAVSVAAGSCYSVVESPDFFNGTDGAQTLATLPLQADVSNTSDVFLIELLDIGESSNSKAMDAIKTKTDQFPGAVVLFHGKQRRGIFDDVASFVRQHVQDQADIMYEEIQREHRRLREEQERLDRAADIASRIRAQWQSWEDDEMIRRRRWDSMRWHPDESANRREEERRAEWDAAHTEEHQAEWEAAQNAVYEHIR